jgi:hypothetical protein
MIDVLAAAMSFVKYLPVRGICSTRPTWSHARLKIASRSSWYHSGEIESS